MSSIDKVEPLTSILSEATVNYAYGDGSSEHSRVGWVEERNPTNLPALIPQAVTVRAMRSDLSGVGGERLLSCKMRLLI
jgi:hypothetical protein